MLLERRERDREQERERARAPRPQRDWEGLLNRGRVEPEPGDWMAGPPVYEPARAAPPPCIPAVDLGGRPDEMLWMLNPGAYLFCMGLLASQYLQPVTLF